MCVCVCVYVWPRCQSIAIRRANVLEYYYKNISGEIKRVEEQPEMTRLTDLVCYGLMTLEGSTIVHLHITGQHTQ